MIIKIEFPEIFHIVNNNKMVTLETRLTPEVLKNITDDDIKSCVTQILAGVNDGRPNHKLKSNYAEWLISDYKNRIEKLSKYSYIKDELDELTKSIENCERFRQQVENDLSFGNYYLSKSKKKGNLFDRDSGWDEWEGNKLLSYAYQDLPELEKSEAHCRHLLKKIEKRVQQYEWSRKRFKK